MTITGKSPTSAEDIETAVGLSADLLDGHHAGHSENCIPVSDGLVNENLNADTVDGYHVGHTFERIPVSDGELNSMLNADMLDGIHAGNDSNMIPIANGKICKNLNAQYVGGVSADDLVTMSDGSINQSVGSLNVSSIVAGSIDVTTLRASNMTRYVTYSYQSGSSWYRTWSDGFIEQHGTCGNGGTQNFIKPFSNQSSISLQGTPTGGGHPDDCYCILSVQSTSTFSVSA